MSSQRISLGGVIGNIGLMADGDWVESKDQDPNGDVRLIQLADVGDGEYINKSNRFLTSEKAAQLRCTFLKAGDVLVSRMADPIGRACTFPGDPKPCVAVVDICVIRPDPSVVNPEWLKYAINTPRFRAIVKSMAVGATRPRISGKNLRAMELYLPPLSEQLRIVDLLSRAEGIVRLRREAKKKAAELIPALFLDRFGDPATNPKGWPVQSLKSLVSFVSGGTPSKSRDDFWEGDLPWVSPKDMKRVGIDSATDHVNRKVLTETSIKLIPIGSVLIVVRGMILIHTVPVAQSLVPMTINQDMKALIPMPSVNGIYLLWSLRVRQARLLNLVATAAHGTKKLETDQLEALSVPLPPLADQEHFAERLASIESIQAQQSAALATAQATFDALLAQAFSPA